MRTAEQVKGQNGTCDTLKIVAEVTEENPNGFIVIDKHAFNIKKHVLFETEEEQEDAAFDFSTQNKAALQAHLASKGVEFPADALKADLVALCQANP